MAFTRRSIYHRRTACRKITTCYRFLILFYRDSCRMYSFTLLTIETMALSGKLSYQFFSTFTIHTLNFFSYKHYKQGDVDTTYSELPIGRVIDAGFYHDVRRISVYRSLKAFYHSPAAGCRGFSNNPAITSAI
jgi:hypothetical protein